MDVTTLTRTARQADAEMARGKKRLIEAVRQAEREGLSQREIARAVGRSQPEVSRLLRFHGTSPHARALRRHERDVARILADAGMSNPRVFGSTARGDDTPGSDIDLLVTAEDPVGLLALSRIEQELSDVIGVRVDLVLDRSIRPDLRDEILSTAVRL